MTDTTIQLQRPVGAPTPAWIVMVFAMVGIAMGSAAWAGGHWPLSVVVLLGVGLAFLIVIRSPHVGISVFLTTFLINYPSVARGAGYFTINNALGALFVGLLAWDYYLRRDAWYLREPLVRILLIIGVAMLVGTAVAEFTLPDSAVQRLLVRRIGAKGAGVDYTERQLFQYFSRVAFVVFVLQFVRTPRQLSVVFMTLLACILAAVPDALTQYAQAGFQEEVRLRASIVNWADNVNRFAFGCVLGIGFLYHLFNTARARLTQVASALGTLLLIPLVVMSASRSGFLGMCLLGVLIGVGAFGTPKVGRGRATTIMGIASLTLVGVLTFFFVLGPQLQERLLNINPFAERHLEGARSAQQRAESAEESFDLFRRYPILGTGIGNFRWVNKYHHQSRWKPPHNSYLWAGAEGGIVLLSLYLLLFGSMWRRLGRLRSAYAVRTDLRLYPNWLRVYMLLLLFFSFFADVWLEVHVFLLVAATVLLEHWSKASPTESPDDRSSSAGIPGLRAGTSSRPAAA